jgi:hypothetical protein
MKECPRWKLFQLLLKVRSGEHIKSKYVQYFKVAVITMETPNWNMGQMLFENPKPSLDTKFPIKLFSLNE